MFHLLLTATRMLLLLTVLTGALYTAAVTGICAVLFPHAAAGSFIDRDGVPLGSDLLGQPFNSPRYFWGRPSATSPAYNYSSSAGSNLAATNPALLTVVNERLAKLRESDLSNEAAVPVDLVTASGSGLDPHISPAAAYYQAQRVAAARKLPENDVRELIAGHVEPPTLGFLGQPRVNVLRLNLALDSLH